MCVPCSFSLLAYPGNARVVRYPKDQGCRHPRLCSYVSHCSLSICDMCLALLCRTEGFKLNLNYFNLLKAELWGAAGSAQKTAVLSVPEPWKDRSGGRSLSSLCESHDFYLSEVGQNQNKLPDPKSVIYFDLQYCNQVPQCLSPSRTSEEFRYPTNLGC